MIVSGGQTGVDRAALDVALELGIPCGGWCPLGRLAEDGVLADRYPLRETESADYSQRTEWNLRDSDGTLIIARGTLTGGTALTESLARRLGKPCLVADPDLEPDLTSIREWIEAKDIRKLNVAGPRESSQPGIYSQAAGILRGILDPPE